ncbi:unnamed protein product [Paramecium octaurelia]|uniref:VWFA domain-containing protein n=1 Tax=Paramecium octaurelia TaxID=43137 RepID=A0A8S1T9U6_PAROT|nr:unnamed protein product [Paramecium octaurelia]
MDLALLMGLLGFETARTSKLRYLLPRIQCSGSTAFRDAVVQGNELMLKLFSLFVKEGLHDKFQIVHVVLTDGDDCASQTSHQDFLKYQLYLYSQLPPQMLKTFYIGVNLENNSTVRQQMKQIIDCSCESAQYYSINSNGINEIFQKIQMQIGIEVQQRGLVMKNEHMTIGLMQEKYRPVVQITVNNYIVIFTLDISGSMENNWPKVCGAVSGFLDNLGENDLVLGITFNNQVNIITKPELEKKIQNPRPPPPQSNSNVPDEGYYCCKIF